MKLLYFDDQVDDLHHSLRKLYRLAKSKALLSSLLLALTEALQDEVAGLPAPEKGLLPHFATLLDLAAVSDGDIILSTVLLNVVQLGWLQMSVRCANRRLLRLTDFQPCRIRPEDS